MVRAGVSDHSVLSLTLRLLVFLRINLTRYGISRP